MQPTIITRDPILPPPPTPETVPADLALARLNGLGVDGWTVLWSDASHAVFPVVFEPLPRRFIIPIAVRFDAADLPTDDDVLRALLWERFRQAAEHGARRGGGEPTRADEIRRAWDRGPLHRVYPGNGTVELVLGGHVAPV